LQAPKHLRSSTFVTTQQPAHQTVRTLHDAMLLAMMLLMSDKWLRVCFAQAKKEAEENQAEVPESSSGSGPARSQTGSSDVAAGFLASVMQTNLMSSDQDMRPGDPA
jgi:hypothetical protein